MLRRGQRVALLFGVGLGEFWDLCPSEVLARIAAEKWRMRVVYGVTFAADAVPDDEDRTESILDGLVAQTAGPAEEIAP